MREQVFSFILSWETIDYFIPVLVFDWLSSIILHLDMYDFPLNSFNSCAYNYSLAVLMFLGFYCKNNYFFHKK